MPDTLKNRRARNLILALSVLFILEFTHITSIEPSDARLEQSVSAGCDGGGVAGGRETGTMSGSRESMYSDLRWCFQ